jgi:hypothetical protein
MVRSIFSEGGFDLFNKLEEFFPGPETSECLILVPSEVGAGRITQPSDIARHV